MKRYRDVLNILHLNQIMKEDTRITNTTNTLIDHINVNRTEMYYKCGSLDLGISDHNLIYTARKKFKEESDTSFIWTRSYRKYNKELFSRDVNRTCWNFILDTRDINTAVKQFMQTITSIIDRYAPFKWVKCHGNHAKWVTNEFLGLIDAREYFVKKCKKAPSIVNNRKRQDAIKAVNVMKRRLQRDYIEEAIQSGKGNSKETWKRLKQVWPLKNKSTKIIELNGKCDKQDIAEEINQYFANIGQKLASDIGEVGWEPPKDAHPPTFEFSDVSLTRVQEMIKNLNCSKACGQDGLTARLLKDAGPTITPVPTHIFNLSLKTKQFPNDWKTSLVSPIFKDGERDKPSNYRPIALLSIPSKMLEHIAHEQLSAHLRHIDYFNRAQSGFRKGHSTTTHVVNANHSVFKNGYFFQDIYI